MDGTFAIARLLKKPILAVKLLSAWNYLSLAWIEATRHVSSEKSS
jgi:hypothetical protein